MKSDSTRHSFNKTTHYPQSQHHHWLSNESIKDYIELNKAIPRLITDKKLISQTKAVKWGVLLKSHRFPNKSNKKKHQLLSLFSTEEKIAIKTEANTIVNTLTRITSSHSPIDQTYINTNKRNSINHHRSQSKYDSDLKNIINGNKKTIEMLTIDQKNKYVFHSYDIQLAIFGQEKYRNIFINGVNQYKRDGLKYNALPLSPTRKENKELNNKVLNELKLNKKKSLRFCFKEFPKKTRNKLFPTLSHKTQTQTQRDHCLKHDDYLEIDSQETFDQRVNNTLSQAKCLLNTIETNRGLIKHNKVFSVEVHSS